MSENDGAFIVRPDSPAARYVTPVLAALCDAAGELDAAVYHLAVGDNPPILTLSIVEGAGLVGSVAYELERLMGIIDVLTAVFGGQVLPPNPDIPVVRPTLE